MLRLFVSALGNNLKNNSTKFIAPSRNALFSQPSAMFSEAQNVSTESGIIVIKGLPPTWFEKDIVSYFDKTNSIQKVNLVKNREGQNTGKAVITFPAKSQAESFIQKWNQFQLQVDSFNQQLVAQLFAPKQAQETPKESHSDIKQVYVYGLPWKCEKEDLFKLAAEYGDVISLDLPLTSNNKNKGFAYINFNEHDAAQRFLQNVNEKNFLGRKIKVTLSKAKHHEEKGAKSPISAFSFGRQKESVAESDTYADNLGLYKKILAVQEKQTSQKGQSIGQFYTNYDRSNEFEF